MTSLPVFPQTFPSQLYYISAGFGWLFEDACNFQLFLNPPPFLRTQNSNWNSKEPFVQTLTPTCGHTKRIPLIMQPKLKEQACEIKTKVKTAPISKNLVISLTCPKCCNKPITILIYTLDLKLISLFSKMQKLLHSYVQNYFLIENY